MKSLKNIFVNFFTRANGDTQRAQLILPFLLENIPDMVFVKDYQGLRFVQFNKAAEELLGYSREEMIGKNDYDFFPKEEADFFTSKDREVFGSKRLVDIPEEPIRTKYKGQRLLRTRKIPIYDELGRPQYLMGISEDITERKQKEDERERLVLQLREALAMVKTLSGLLPICSYCKNIRDDQGYWNQVEAYIGARSEVTFTHGVCPVCLRKHHPQMYQQIVEEESGKEP